MSRSDEQRVFILGLDGVPWGLLSEWVEAGELPTFERVFESGVAGPLKSTTPASTPLAWPSISTGTWPDKHGIYSFQRLHSNYRHRMYTSGDIERAALWDMLTPALVANVPITYPASVIDGTMVTGMLTRDRDEGFTHPTSFAAEIDRRIPDYRVSLDWSKYRSNREEFLADLDDLLTSRRELLRLLMERENWRLFYFVFTAPDRLQHLIWDPDVLIDHYRDLDDILAEVLDYVEEVGASLFVVSDHGFGPVERTVNVNTILEREGYLTSDAKAVGGPLSRIGVTRERVEAVLETIGIDENTIVNTLPRSVVDRVASTMAGEHNLYDVNHDMTEAFMHGVKSVYINDTERFDDGIVSPAEIPPLVSELAEMFARVKDPRTGQRVFTVHYGDELFPRDEYAPNLVLEASDHVVQNSLADEAFSDSEGIEGDHRPEGIFLAYGPNIDAGSSPQNATVVDVAPTVLHTVGEPVPEETDGRVLSEIYAPDTDSARREIETRRYTGSEIREVDGDFSHVEERLEGLGYMT